MFEYKEEEYENLLMCLSGGMLSEDMQDDEVAIMIEFAGENWFDNMGYTEPLYKKPAYYRQ